MRLQIEFVIMILTLLEYHLQVAAHIRLSNWRMYIPVFQWWQLSVL